jgi:hypothetical protein
MIWISIKKHGLVVAILLVLSGCSLVAISPTTATPTKSLLRYTNKLLSFLPKWLMSWVVNINIIYPSIKIPKCL